MTGVLKLAILLSALAVNECSHFEEPVLTDNSQLAEEMEAEKGIPALDFNKGSIDDFSGEIYSWWAANDQIRLARKGDTLKVQFNNVGPLYTPFGRQITPLDFSENQAIRIRARAEGKSSPIVRIDLKDNLGLITNTAAPSVRVPVGQDYQDFYFNYKDKWKQSYPTSGKVDPTLISEALFFINPGMSGFTGTLFIDEIASVRVEDIPKKEGMAGGFIETFEEEPSSWWTGSSKISLEKVQDKDVVRIVSSGAGPGYETFGKGFDQMDFTKAPIIRIKAKAEPNGGQELPKLRVGVKDRDGYVTNEFHLIETIDSKDDFKNYFFNLKGKFSQNYPDAHKVNPKEIIEIMMFVNAGGAAYFGNIYVDEIEVITEKKFEELTKK